MSKTETFGSQLQKMNANEEENNPAQSLGNTSKSTEIQGNAVENSNNNLAFDKQDGHNEKTQKKINELISQIRELYNTRRRMITDYTGMQCVDEDFEVSVKLAEKIKDDYSQVMSIKESLGDFNDSIRELQNDICAFWK